jgi:DNA-binding NtrC family response regulator
MLPEAAVSTFEAQAPAVSPKRLRILVADSAEADRQSLKALLRRINEGVEVLEASNGPTAERMLRERNVDIAFIDRRLPGFDGREVQNWSSMTGHRSLFVLVSDKLVPRWSEIATLINAYEVMLKPFNESHVENLLGVYGRLSRRSKVLVVDKSRTARRIVREMLDKSRFNCAIDETDTGAHAQRAVGRAPFDVIMVDAELDGGSGTEIACRLARDAPDAKVILIGGVEMKAFAANLDQFDLAGFLQKPFDVPALENALHDAMKLWRPYRLNAQLRPV